VAGVAPAPSYLAFVRAYDFEDPSDPADAYRELSIGAIEGTLHFLRARDLAIKDADAGWRRAAGLGSYPVAALRASALGGAPSTPSTVALAPGGADLVLVDPAGRARRAGPTFGELLRYLALGWKARTEVEEDLIGALMLRARLRS
jgi:hypothetical protein